MVQTTPSLAGPLATLEISDRRLPARMVMGRVRADLPRQPRLAGLPPMLAAPLLNVTRHRQD